MLHSLKIVIHGNGNLNYFCFSFANTKNHFIKLTREYLRMNYKSDVLIKFGEFRQSKIKGRDKMTFILKRKKK